MARLITNLTAAGAVAGANLLWLEQSALPRKLSITSLESHLNANLSFAASSHTHPLSEITDEGALAALNTVGTSEIDNDAVTYAKIQNVTQTDVLLGRDTAGAGIVEEILPTAARTLLNVDVAGTDNSTDVTLIGTPNYITISGQVITRNKLDIADDTNLIDGTGLTLSVNTLSVDAAQTQITSLGTLTSLALSGDIDLNGNNIDDMGVIFMREQAAADGDVVAQGQLWVRSDTPNQLMFTDDDGGDFAISQHVTPDLTISTTGTHTPFSLANSLQEIYFTQATAANADTFASTGGSQTEIPDGTQWVGKNNGVGTLTIRGGTSVTIRFWAADGSAPADVDVTIARGSVFYVHKVSDTIYDVWGNGAS